MQKEYDTGQNEIWKQKLANRNVLWKLLVSYADNFLLLDGTGIVLDFQAIYLIWSCRALSIPYAIKIAKGALTF